MAFLKHMRGWRLNGAVVSLFLMGCVVALAGYWNTDFSGVRIGSDQDLSDGVKINVLDAADLTFAGHTSRTATVDVGTTYYVAATFKSSSADPGKITAAVSGGTLTVTTANATTGTCSVILLGSP